MEKVTVDKEGCMCCKCRKFIPENLSLNCAANSVMLKLYAKFQVGVKTTECPNFEERKDEQV